MANFILIPSMKIQAVQQLAAAEPLGSSKFFFKLSDKVNRRNKPQVERHPQAKESHDESTGKWRSRKSLLEDNLFQYNYILRFKDGIS